MPEEDTEHEIVRFRREEIADLGAMPSASGQVEMLSSNRPAHRLARLSGYCVFAFAGLIAITWLAITLVGSSAFVSRMLQGHVEAAVRQAMGPSAKLSMGQARLGLDGAQALAVHLDHFQLSERPGAARLEAQELSVGVQLMPLLAGRFELANARVGQARVELGGGSGSPAWLAAISDDRGLIDPDRIAPAAFELIQQLLDIANRSKGGSLILQDIAVVSGGQTINIDNLTLASADSNVAIEGQIGFNGVDYTLNGTATSIAGKAAAFNVSIRDASADEIAASEGTITGSRNDGKDTVRLAIRRANNEIDFGPRGVVKSDIDLVARVVQGEGKAEVERLNLTSGQNRFRYTGAFGKHPDRAGFPMYRFELVSNDSVIAPEESTEATMPTAIRLSGTYRPDNSELNLGDIRVRASSGEANATAKMFFVKGKSPALKLDVNVQSMDVAQVKQLWPWLAAGGARRWVMNNLFGGEVVRGHISYDIVAGRLQDRTPLNAEEVSGQVEITGSRFDTAGVLPAVREAVGSINFAGETVNISLSSGKAFVGEGQEVALSNGTLAIADVRVRPLIARLDMDFSGDAQAIVEVASREPLNALRNIDLSPADLTGSVTGRVSADIPLQKGTDAKTLDWGVDVKYQNLAIAKPIQGQRIDQAEGSMQLLPDRAIIKAKGRMNGIPAEFDLVQPIRGGAVPVKRDIALTVGDKERGLLAPGLNSIMSGPMKLQLDAATPQMRKIKADLTQTRLSLPWAGWSKGAGIAASASLDLAPNGQVRNLRISGKTFSAHGAIDMNGGDFRSADFDQFSLNPGDNLALKVRRDGNAYKVSVSGASLDGRALIKQLYEQADSASGARTSIVLDADVTLLGGFNNEELRNAKIAYRSGGGGGSASISGIMGRNASFSMNDERRSGNRRVSVTSSDAGSLLRFLNVYTRMQGGNLSLSLAGADTLRGQIEVKNFQVVNEPRLNSLVASRPAGADQSLNDATNSRIDTGRVQFSRAYAQLAKGPKSLRVANAVLRGPVIGTTFEGTVFNADDQMDLTGTFLPAYGLNSIFGDIPLLGAFLGGGQNGGLIGVTYRLKGNMRTPSVEVNPLSAIAPGIFRKIFEY